MKTVVSTFLALYFFTGSLFPKSDMDELFKIPALMEHYSVHKANAHDDFSFVDFLWLHYAIGSTHEEQAHDQLPLSMDMCTGIICTLISTLELIVHPIVQITKVTSSFYSLQYSFLSIFSLLNPPK
jgi:hypothetical protein